MAFIDMDSDDDDSVAPDLVVLRDEASFYGMQSDLPVTAEVSGGSAEKQEHSSTTSSPHDRQQPCPVTILTGFLGSGKTTLVQHILNDTNHGKRIAVIENEFGGGQESKSTTNSSSNPDPGLSVESMIVRDGGANVDKNQENPNLIDLIELPNGCVCCTVKDSLIVTLETLLSREKRGFDYILIEASGMANPGPIASLFWLDDALESQLRLDGIVCCVDARNFLQQVNDTVEAAQQVAYADRILLNKIDLLSTEHDLEMVSNEIRSINVTAPVLQTQYSKVDDLDWILDAGCFDVDRAKEVESVLHRVDDASSSMHRQCNRASCTLCTAPQFTNGPFCDPCQPDFSAATKTHAHTRLVSSIALVHPGSVDLKQMNQWLASILWPDQDVEDSVITARLEGEQSLVEQNESNKSAMQIFRIKGILSVACSFEEENEDEKSEACQLGDTGLDARRFIVQAVHDLWDIHDANDALRWDDSNSEVRFCKLVVIGRNLDHDKLWEGFLSCFINS